MTDKDCGCKKRRQQTGGDADLELARALATARSIGDTRRIERLEAEQSRRRLQRQALDNQRQKAARP